MKKIVSLILILLITISISGAVLAATSCNINLQSSKSELSKNEQFEVYANISNLKSDRGIISLGATLEYDKDSLSLEKMEGQNGWETPIANSGYNEANGKLVISKNGFATKDESFLKLTFKVKDSSKSNFTVTLKDVTVADGVAPVSVSAASKSFTLKSGTPTPPPSTTNTIGGNTTTGGNEVNNGNNNTGNTNNNRNETQNTNTNSANGNKNSNSTTQNQLKITTNVAKDKELPKTGNNTYMIVIPIALLIAISIVSFIMYKKKAI